MIEDKFNGVERDCAAHAVKPGFYQEDQGGDRTFRGVWRRRRGFLRTDIAKFTTVPTSVLTFEVPGNGIATVIVEGATIHGFTNVGEQTF